MGFSFLFSVDIGRPGPSEEPDGAHARSMRHRRRLRRFPVAVQLGQPLRRYPISRGALLLPPPPPPPPHLLIILNLILRLLLLEPPEGAAFQPLYD